MQHSPCILETAVAWADARPSSSRKAKNWEWMECWPLVTIQTTHVLPIYIILFLPLKATACREVPKSTVQFVINVRQFLQGAGSSFGYGSRGWPFNLAAVEVVCQLYK